jgi:hypothetical protein
MTTTKKFTYWEVERLIESTTDYVMNQNAGIGLVKVRQGLDIDLSDITSLNKEVNEIMLEARKAIHEKLKTFINSHNG